MQNYHDFEEMIENEKVLADLHGDTDQMKSVATCLLKQNNFWIYHTHKIEDSEEEKANPGDKLWLVLRHMANDPDHGF